MPGSKAVVDRIDTVLSTTPTGVCKSLIKRLRNLNSPQYRLGVGDYRVFYNVEEDTKRVYVLRVLEGGDVDEYLKEMRHEGEDN